MKNLVKKLINAAGFDIVRCRSPLEANMNIGERLGYELEDEATECIKMVEGKTMLSKRRLVTLYQQVAYCEKFNIPGAFIECGVWKGGAVALMALANMKNSATPRIMHLFDSFEEICEPDASVDGERALAEVRKFTGKCGHDKGVLRPLTGIYDSFGGPGSLEENKLFMNTIIGYPEEFSHYHVGWFQDTIPADYGDIGPIAILRLDGDWYASTKVCLEYLFDKVVKGGVVIIDDYGSYEGCKNAVDEFLATRQLKYYLHTIDNTGRYLII